jgi:hypothetical protein
MRASRPDDQSTDSDTSHSIRDLLHLFAWIDCEIGDRFPSLTANGDPQLNVSVLMPSAELEFAFEGLPYTDAGPSTPIGCEPSEEVRQILEAGGVVSVDFARHREFVNLQLDSEPLRRARRHVCRQPQVALTGVELDGSHSTMLAQYVGEDARTAAASRAVGQVSAGFEPGRVVVVVAVLVAAIACLVYRVSVVRALGTGWRIVSALPGTRVSTTASRGGSTCGCRCNCCGPVYAPEQLEALVEHLDDMTVEVDQPDVKIRVFCE